MKFKMPLVIGVTLVSIYLLQGVRLALGLTSGIVDAISFFLIAINFVYAGLFAMALYLLRYGGKIASIFTVAIVSFNVLRLMPATLSGELGLGFMLSHALLMALALVFAVSVLIHFKTQNSHLSRSNP
jgi:hypothetical protein